MVTDLAKTPEGVALWQRFDDAVARCRRLEAAHGIPLWRTYIDSRNRVRELPDAALPEDYVQALAEWDAARIARNALYTQEHASTKGQLTNPS